MANPDTLLLLIIVGLVTVPIIPIFSSLTRSMFQHKVNSLESELGVGLPGWVPVLLPGLVVVGVVLGLGHGGGGVRAGTRRICLHALPRPEL